jgi:4'-phosphopantetheinyl transferase EntD
MIENIAPASLSVFSIFGDSLCDCFDEELVFVRNAIETRRNEFSRGRYCAHQAFRKLGELSIAIPVHATRRPIWPEGYQGSITHCRQYTAAAIGRGSDFLAIGIDAEENLPLPHGVWEMISTPRDREGLSKLPSFPSHQPSRPMIAWERLVFSAKESVYKTWSCLSDQWLDFKDCTIEINPATDTCTAEISKPLEKAESTGASSPPWIWHGRYAWNSEHLVTLVYLATEEK